MTERTLLSITLVDVDGRVDCRVHDGIQHLTAASTDPDTPRVALCLSRLGDHAVHAVQTGQILEGPAPRKGKKRADPVAEDPPVVDTRPKWKQDRSL